MWLPDRTLAASVLLRVVEKMSRNPVERVAEEESICTTVVRAVADARDTDPIDLPPIWNGIDPDAVDRLFDGRPWGRLTFDVLDCEVTVRGDRTVVVRATDAIRGPAADRTIGGVDGNSTEAPTVE